MQQALPYCKMIHVPFAYSSNGASFAFHHRTSQATQTEIDLSLDAFPSPEELHAKGILADEADPPEAYGLLRRIVGAASREGREESDRAWRVPLNTVKERGFNLDIKNPHVAEDDLGDPEMLLNNLTKTEALVQSLRAELKNILRETLLR